MKKLLFLLISLFSISQNVDAVSKMRAIKCSLPKLHQRFNCTSQERAIGRRWLAAATITTVAAAIAAIIGGISAAEIKRAKAEAEKSGAFRPRPTFEIMSKKYALSQKPGMWDKWLVDTALNWSNDWVVGSIINQVENDLTRVTADAIRAAIEAGEYWQQSPKKDVNANLILDLKQLLSKKLKQVEDAPRFVPTIIPPPPLVTLPMQPNPILQN